MSLSRAVSSTCVSTFRHAPSPNTKTWSSTTALSHMLPSGHPLHVTQITLLTACVWYHYIATLSTEEKGQWISVHNNRCTVQNSQQLADNAWWTWRMHLLHVAPSLFPLSLPSHAGWLCCTCHSRLHDTDISELFSQGTILHKGSLHMAITYR